MSKTGDFFGENNPTSVYIPGSQIFHVQDQRAQGTAGGNAALATWNARTLNTVILNTIPGASLGSNIITLPAGTYDITLEATMKGTGLGSVRLYNTADSAVAIAGTNISLDATYTESVANTVTQRITIAAQKTFRLESYSTAARATDGLGAAVSNGVEVYANVFISKVA